MHFSDEWLAGYLEGEGWFGLKHDKPTLQVQSTDQDVVQFVAENLGCPMFGPYSRKAVERQHHKPVYVAQQCGHNAQATMERIRPWMGQRRSEVLEGIMGTERPKAAPHGVEWLAGILEGEGCFSYWTNCPYVQVRMTDEDVVRNVPPLMPGRTARVRREDRSNQGWSDIYSYRVGGSYARATMEGVLPFMSRRRTARIEELLRG